MTTDTKAELPRPMEDPDRKETTCRRILSALPDWFGVPEALEAYAVQCRALPFFAQDAEGETAGFCAVTRHNEATAEIVVMGILPAYHRQGIGRLLVQAAEDWAKAQGLSLLLVKTLDGSDPYYARTRAFYRAMGFLPLESLPLWDERNPCLLMVKPLGAAGMERA
ncbi:MAG TPA: GNAT family N-acetyltransferase [Clostridia bacterium]|nr:GNAT family N-acetyltransferase [Clostridia bacterium]